MLINLWVRDKRDGHIHQVGTDVHDSVEYLCGEVVYVNMQSTASTLDEYEWVEPPDVDDYVSVSPEEREKTVQNKLKEIFLMDDSFGGLADD